MPASDPLSDHSSRIDRLSLRFGAAFALFMAVAFFGLFLFARSAVSQQVERSLLHDRAKLIGSGPIPGHEEIQRRIMSFETGHPASSRGHVIFDPDGRLVLGEVVMHDPGAGFSKVVYQDIGARHNRRADTLGVTLPDGYRLVIFAHSEFDQNLDRSLGPTILALLFFSGGGGILVTLLLGREISRRLRQTIQAADAIGDGDTARRVPLEKLDGVFLLQAASFNRMLDRMEDLITRQRQFSGSLAHNLRTPLTRLRGLLAQLDKTPEADGRASILTQAKQESAAIIDIFDSLLRLSEIEAGLHPAALQPVALRPLIEDVAETMEPVLADMGRSLAIDDIADAWVLADSSLLSQMLVNMLENVALHTPIGTTARISLRHDDAHSAVVMSLRDDGPGLPANDRQRVVRPYVRGSGSNQVRGSGLGLALVQAIVGFHRGELRLSDNLPGLRADISLPRSTAPA